MDMHLDSIVVSLTDDNKKPFREFDSKRNENGRRCSIFMPFDSEYKIFIKNLLSQRIKLNIEIDGTTVSGNGLIINANEQSHIERFVDIAKKFKFVKAQGSGANPNVSDPTSPENGIIKVRVTKEKKEEITPKIVEHHHHYPWYYTPPYWMNNVTYTSDTARPNNLRSLSKMSKSINDDNIQCYNNTMNWMSESSLLIGSVNSVQPVENIGATIEGNKSDQSFGFTKWNGDEGQELVFTFYVKGANTLENDKDYQEYLRLKEKFG